MISSNEQMALSDILYMEKMIKELICTQQIQDSSDKLTI